MKNIHILPTDKPSKLFLSKRKNQFFLNEEFDESSPKIIAHHIYITSDEEIKDGDWILSVTNKVMKVTQKSLNLLKPPFIKLYWRKIILTTDQDLIKDGVQAIDDDFLEWFVSKANDSGKSIDIVDIGDGLYFDGVEWISCYKIIIPKEEIVLEDIFNDEKREGVKMIINQHKVLKGLSLINPLHLQMTSDGHGEFPDSYKLTEKGIQYIIEKLNKE